MTGTSAPKGSLADQIYDELLSSLRDQEGFDANLIEMLRRLATRRELTSRAKLQEVLKSQEPEHEGA